MISVVIPNYNHALYLKKRIDSILNQTYKDFEIILLDDKSQDNSIEIIEEYRNNPHVSHIEFNSNNSGSTFKQWNKGIQLAAGEYILIAESDDMAAPELLQVLYNNMIEDEKNVISYCQSYRMDKNDKIKGDWSFQTKKSKSNIFDSDFKMAGDAFIYNYLIHSNIIPNASAVLFRRDIFHKVGKADESIKFCSDWHLWLKMLCFGNIVFTKQKLNYFRYSEQSVIALALGNKEIFDTKYDILMRFNYNKFLKNNYSNYGIISANKLCIKKNSKQELSLLLKYKKYFSAVKYLFYYLRYSKHFLR